MEAENEELRQRLAEAERKNCIGGLDEGYELPTTENVKPVATNPSNCQ